MPGFRHAAVLAGVLAAAIGLQAGPARPAGDWQDTFLLDLRAGNARSALADQLGSGGYELSDGRRVDFQGWYRSRWRDLEVSFLTDLGGGFGVIWGISTGERGPKYRIDPALRLGFIAQWPVGRLGTFTVTGETHLGGRMDEDPCTADYGAIGGVQAVNCRLAASDIPPDETLDALIGMSATRETSVRMSLEFRF